MRPDYIILRAQNLTSPLHLTELSEELNNTLVTHLTVCVAVS